MSFSEALTDKLKLLLYENKDAEAVRLLQEESDLGYEDAQTYVERLKKSLGKGTKTPVKTKARLLLIVFAGLSGVFWILAITFYITKSEQLEHSVLVEGTVSEVVHNESGSAPVVSYVYEEKEYQYFSSIYSSPPSYAVGDVVELYVSLDNPQDAMINSFIERWLIIMIFGILALVFDIVAVIAFLARNTSSSASMVFGDDDDGFSRDFD